MSEFTKMLPPVPMFGGSRDGASHPVEVLFPTINGGVPCSYVRFPDGEMYELAKDRSRWIFMPTKVAPPEEPK